MGADAFGQDLIGLWRDEGVGIDFVKTAPGDPTGLYFVKPHASGRDFTYARRGSAASLYAPEDLPEAGIAGARVLHASAVSLAIGPAMRAAVFRAAKIARGAGTLVSFDTNLRLNLWSLDEARAMIDAMLPLSDIIFPSEDEAELLTGLSDPDAIVDHYLGFGASVVALKRGVQGALIATPEARHAIPPAPARPVDLTGAGDSFAGAFLAYYLETGDVCQSGELAGKVAAGTVSGFGAIDPIPHRQSLFVG